VTKKEEGIKALFFRLGFALILVKGGGTLVNWGGRGRTITWAKEITFKNKKEEGSSTKDEEKN